MLIAITGLWDLAFGAGSPNNGATNQLFFTAGFTGEDPTGNGLFGMIQAVGGGGNSTAAAAALALPVAGRGNASTPGAVGPGGQRTHPAALPASGPTPQRSAPSHGPASALARLVSPAGHGLVLDQVFADLSGNTLWHIL